MKRPGRGLQLRWKIVGPYALLAVVLALFGAALVTRLVAGSLEERFTNQLIESSRVTADAMVRQERRHLTVLRAIAFTEGVPEAVLARETGELGDAALPIVVNAGVETVEVVDARGARLFAARFDGAEYVTLHEPATRTDWPFVRDVLAGRNDGLGDKMAGIAGGDHGLTFYSAGPIHDPLGRIAGAVIVGTSLPSLAAGLKSEAMADVTLYDGNGRLLISTFPLAEAEEELNPLVPAHELVAGLSERRALFDRDYQVLYNELQIRQAPLAWYSVALPRSFITTFVGTARLQMMFFFTVATLAILAIGWFLARAMTRPLARLLQAANAVSLGDLTVRSGVRGGDEIGVLAGAFDHMTERLERYHVNTLAALVSSIDARDAYTRGHSVRVGRLAAEIGRELSMTSSELQQLQMGGMLHDIGKIGIRDHVLLKPGRLSDEERCLIQEHPSIGLRILETVELPAEVLNAVGGHHERLDGSGYPLGLGGDDLSLFPRIVSVADVYDALVTDRPYRAALESSVALRMLQEEVDRGLLDGDALAALCRIADAWEVRRRSDETLDGFALEVRRSGADAVLVLRS